MEWSAAVAAPSARSRSAETVAGILLVPARTVVSTAIALNTLAEMNYATRRAVVTTWQERRPI